MTKERECTLGEAREATLIAYLYDELESRERVAFERHVNLCQPCRVEVADFSYVREGLAAWAAPDVGEGVGGRPPQSTLRLAGPPPRPGGWRVLAEAPLWMQAAAAMLVVAASLGLANINLTYKSDGLTVTTGWMPPAPALVPAVAPVAATPAAARTAADVEPWRAELVALEQRLRSNLETSASPVNASADDEALMKRVRALVQESERRQQRELLLRVAEVARDNQAQRQADLVRIDRTLGVLQNRTGVEVMRTQQQLNSLAQRVSSQR